MLVLFRATYFSTYNQYQKIDILSFFRFCERLEKACIETIESGKMTKDLAICVHGTTAVKPDQYLNTMEFLEAIAKRLEQLAA